MYCIVYNERIRRDRLVPFVICMFYSVHDTLLRNPINIFSFLYHNHLHYYYYAPYGTWGKEVQMLSVKYEPKNEHSIDPRDRTTSEFLSPNSVFFKK